MDKTFNSSIMGTIINGKPVVVDGKLIADSSSAEQIFLIDNERFRIFFI